MRRVQIEVLAAAAAVGRWLVDNLHELLLVCALALIARGLLEVWHAGAYLVPGVVLLWIVLPTRHAFVVGDVVERRK
jgi:hypothetical protein